MKQQKVKARVGLFNVYCNEGRDANINNLKNSQGKYLIINQKLALSLKECRQQLFLLLPKPNRL